MKYNWRIVLGVFQSHFEVILSPKANDELNKAIVDMYQEIVEKDAEIKRLTEDNELLKIKTGAYGQLLKVHIGEDMRWLTQDIRLYDSPKSEGE